MFVLVFFFKQKTAYEMRISDWSSDVCSSDLIVQQTATSDVGQTLDGIAMLGQRSQNRFDVNTGRLHDHVFQRTATQLLAGTRIGVGEYLAQQGKSVGMRPAGGKPQDHVALRHGLAVDNARFLARASSAKRHVGKK